MIFFQFIFYIFRNKVLQVTNGVDDLGSMNWGMVLCLFLSWVISYFCVWKSVKQTGKVVYFTATFPLLMLFVLLIRGITLDGAWDGIYFYMIPDMSRMSDPKLGCFIFTRFFGQNFLFVLFDENLDFEENLDF